MTERVGLYGGSFDPIHFGHLIAARSVAEQWDISRVILIPSARPPHKQDHALAPAVDRLEMARRAVAGDSLFDVSDMELCRQGPSYTFDTVAEFRRTLGQDAAMFWIIGGDTLPELPTWFRIGELVKAVRIVTVTRPGWQPPEMTFLAPSVGHDAAEQLLGDCVRTAGIEISASQIRARVRAGRSVRYLVPEGVDAYIRDRGLYRGLA
jgi:nicotinate-nucleotide adenylyltransferase